MEFPNFPSQSLCYMTFAAPGGCLDRISGLIEVSGSFERVELGFELSVGVSKIER